MKLLYTFLAIVSGGLWATAQLQSFEPTSDVSGKEFGTQVAISGNEILASTVSTETTPGKVYLFNTNLQQTGVFYPEDAQLTDSFGASFSIDSDFIAIGAPGHDANNDNSGAAYIYHKVNEQWQFFQKITAIDNNIGDFFGSMTKIKNGFLYVAAIGDEPDSETNTNRGSIYVYTFDGNQWIFSQKLATITYAEWPATGIPSLGQDLSIDNDYMIVRGPTYVTEYRLIDGQWIFQSATQVGPAVGGSNYLMDLDLHEGQEFTLQEGWIAIGLSIRNVLPPYAYQSPELPLLSLENLISYTLIVVNDSNLFVGRVYTNDPPDKRPVAYYKKVGTQWEYHNIFYGNGPTGAEDYFGYTMATSGNKAVFGAAAEGTGKAYYASEAALKTDSFSKNTIEVYPNPVQDILKITNDIGDLSSVQVYSITGKLLLSVESNIKEIDMTNFDTGMYFIKITTTVGTKQSFKVIKN